MKDLRLTAEELLDEGVCVRRPTEEVLGWDSIVNLSYGQTYARVTYLERVDFVPASSWAKDLVAVELHRVPRADAPVGNPFREAPA